MRTKEIVRKGIENYEQLKDVVDLNVYGDVNLEDPIQKRRIISRILAAANTIATENNWMSGNRCIMNRQMFNILKNEPVFVVFDEPQKIESTDRTVVGQMATVKIEVSSFIESNTIVVFREDFENKDKSGINYYYTFQVGVKNEDNNIE